MPAPAPTAALLAQNPGAGQWIILAVVGLVLLFLLLFCLVFARYFNWWVRAFLAGANIPFPMLVMMSLRKSPVADIVRLRIMAVQSGVDIPTHEIERAYLQGADAERAVRAMIRAKELGQDVTWQELLSTDLEMWLAERDKPQ